MKEGDVVEDFEALDQHGNAVRLSDLTAEGPIVLFFYPKAMTTGCTAEACHFRDLTAEFAAVGAKPVGISGDSVEQQAEFDRVNRLGIRLLSDPDRAIAKRFGVKRPGPFGVKRVTFMIDSDRVVRRVISSELNMDAHADEALQALADSAA